jgi:hypothetical protein
MSALGQKQTFAPQKVMSALPPKATLDAYIFECPLRANSGHFVPHRRLDRQIEKMIQRLFTKATR